MRRTKILATLGPSSASKTKIQQLSRAGADAFRINMSHGGQEQWRRLIEHVRRIDPKAAVVMDTKGPELRLRNVTEQFFVKSGDEFLLGLKPHKRLAYISHPIALKKGARLLFDDGMVETRVEKVLEDALRLRIVTGGALSEGRKITAPNANTEFPLLSAQDRKDLRFAMKVGADAVALSFVRSAEDVKAARKVVGKDVMLIAKIENSAGVFAIEEIMQEADGIMVARGDLGVEMSLEQVPLVQKRIVKLCNQAAKPVIVATQMLETMTYNSRPTRAEASDVANAIIDGADCCMLSGETAIGKYPIRTVKTMARIAEKVDPTLSTSLSRISHDRVEVAEAISNAVYDLSLNLQVDAIVSATTSGFTARMVSRFRPACRVLAVAHDEHIMRQLRLSWGVEAMVFDSEPSHRTVVEAVRKANSDRLLRKKDLVVVTAGVDTRKKGSTNLVEVHEVGDLLSTHG